MTKDEALDELYRLASKMNDDTIVLTGEARILIEKICEEYEDDMFDLATKVD